jgi:hypothetical protein
MTDDMTEFVRNSRNFKKLPCKNFVTFSVKHIWLTFAKNLNRIIIGWSLNFISYFLRGVYQRHLKCK